MKKKSNKKKKFYGTVAIIGLGLLGTSLGLALKKKGYKRLGWARRKESRIEAIKNGVIDHSSENAEDVISKADITVICLPVPNIISFCSEFAEKWNKGAIVTDVGSVKEPVVKKNLPLLDRYGVQFIGSHPMAGSEKSGAGAAHASLYNGAVVFLTPAEGNTEEAVRQVKRLWESTGAKTVQIDSRQHDLIVSLSSHLVHVVSMALVKAVLDAEPKYNKLMELACAGAFRDTTRTASSNPQMWREIIENNKNHVLKSIMKFSDCLEKIKLLIEQDKFDQFEKAFSEAKTLRDKWLEKQNIQ